MKYLLMDRSSRIKAPPRPLNAKKRKERRMKNLEHKADRSLNGCSGGVLHSRREIGIPMGVVAFHRSAVVFRLAGQRPPNNKLESA
jgi:hypothetical protein